MAGDVAWRAQLLWSRKHASGELDELVHHLGLDGTDYSALGLKLNGTRVVLALAWREERVAGERDTRRVLDAVNVTAKFERPGDAERTRAEDEATPDLGMPSIELRRETQTDRDDKRSGLTREIQTGYEGFDRMVFVDNDSSDADALRIVSKEATRQAVLRLLASRRQEAVEITTTGVSVRHKVANPNTVDATLLLEAIEDVMIIARAGGPKDARPARRGENLVVLLVGVAVAAVLYALGMWFAYHVDFVPLLLGGVVGGALGLFLQPVIARYVAGDAGSGRRARTLTLTTVVTTAGLFAGALVQLNCALDGETPRLRTGRVTRVREESSGNNRGRHVEVRFPEGTVELRWSEYVRPGMTYFEQVHPGAFGFEWSDGVDIR